MAIYTAVFAAVSMSAAQDVFEITAGATTRVRIRECRIQQYSEPLVTEPEIIPVTIIRGYTVAGTPVGSPTPRNVAGHTGAPVAQSVVTCNNTVLASGGTPLTMVSDAWNISAGFSLRDILRPAIHRDDVSEELILEHGQRLVFRIAAPTDALTGNGTLIFEEVGVPPF